jgi:hypothetical protein
MIQKKKLTLKNNVQIPGEQNRGYDYYFCFKYFTYYLIFLIAHQNLIDVNWYIDRVPLFHFDNCSYSAHFKSDVRSY